MNDDAPPEPPLEDFEDGGSDLAPFGAEDTDQLMANIHRLETDLDAEKEQRSEERFTWVLVCAVLFDVIAIQATGGSNWFFLVFLLQLIALLGYAQKQGVDWAVKLIGWLLYRLSQRFNPGDDDN